jgi:predicted nuclease of restriction endonuclease-like (RecB) superfamily
LKQKRADYGEKIVAATGRQLEREFGRGFSEKSLRHMIRFAQAFPDEQIVSALRRQLTWTHFKSLVYIEDPLKRDFYAEMCRIEGWNTRTLEKKIGGMLFERTALSKKPNRLIRRELDALGAEDRLTPDLVFRDPYFLDVLGLKDSYAEKDLESALLREIESFLLELGAGFAFVARQIRPAGNRAQKHHTAQHGLRRPHKRQHYSGAAAYRPAQRQRTNTRHYQTTTHSRGSCAITQRPAPRARLGYRDHASAGGVN